MAVKPTWGEVPHEYLALVPGKTDCCVLCGNPDGHSLHKTAS